MKEFWFKTFKCPICKTLFEAPMVFSEAIKIKKRDDDLRPVYQGINAIYYGLITCPNCLFTAFEHDYNGLSKEIAGDLKNKIEKVLERAKVQYGDINLGTDRTTEDAVMLHVIAAAIYTLLNKPNRLAEIYLRLAWLYREQGNKKKEVHALGRALVNFNRVYDTAEDYKQIQRCLFYMGEINRRLGKRDEAVKYFSILLSKYRSGGNSIYVRTAQLNRREI